MARHSQRVVTGQQVSFPSSVFAVTLGPDSTLDACEIDGQTLTACNVVYLSSPSMAVPVSRARTHHHAHGSQGALVSLVGWEVGEVPTPTPRLPFRSRDSIPANGSTPDYDSAPPFARIPVYGRRHLRVAITGADYAYYVLAQCVSYTGEGFGSVVDMFELTAQAASSSPLGGGMPTGDWTAATTIAADQNTGVRVAIVAGVVERPLACDEVWLYSASGFATGHTITEVW